MLALGRSEFRDVVCSSWIFYPHIGHVRVRIYKGLAVREFTMKLSGRRKFQKEWPVQWPLWWEFTPGVFTEQPEEDVARAEHVPSRVGEPTETKM